KASKAADTKSSGKNAAKPASKAAAKTRTKPKSKDTGTARAPSPVPMTGHILTPASPAGGTASPSANAPASRAQAAPPPARNSAPLALAATAATAAVDVNAVKRAVDFVRQRKQSEATAIQNSIADPVARKLVEWLILRSDDSSAEFPRYAAFIAENPGWPSLVTLRRKAEALLFQNPQPPATVRAFFARNNPLSAKGRFALARALAASGDAKGAETLVRETWRYDAFSADVEAQVAREFGAVLTRDDYKARMDRRLYAADDGEAGLRMAQRLGGHEPAIAKARIAVAKNAHNAKALLDAVPAAARQDIGYIFSRVKWLRRNDHLAEAAAAILSVRNPIGPQHDLDEWWVERRVLARSLLDHGDAKTAYRVASEATEPPRDHYRGEQQFTAGWIALRFLHDPARAYAHFKQVGEGASDPITLARAAYWQGRAAEAMNQRQRAREPYAEA